MESEILSILLRISPEIIEYVKMIVISLKGDYYFLNLLKKRGKKRKRLFFIFNKN